MSNFNAVASPATLRALTLVPPPPSAFYPAESHRPARTVRRSGVQEVNPWGRLGSYLLESILIVVTLGIGWLIWAAMIGGAGQTPAKRLLGYRVINAQTRQPASLGTMFWVRGLLAGIVAVLAIACTIGVLLFMPFWDKRNQTLWDKVSNTYVVYDSNDQSGTKLGLRLLS